MLFPAALAGAQGLGAASGVLDSAAGTDTTGLKANLSETIGLIIKGALALVGTIFLLLTIYAGILWMTASGKEEQIETAQKIIKATIIGLFITMAAYAITFFVTSRLTGVGGGSAGPVPAQATTCEPNGGICAMGCGPKGKVNGTRPPNYMCCTK